MAGYLPALNLCRSLINGNSVANMTFFNSIGDFLPVSDFVPAPEPSSQVDADTGAVSFSMILAVDILVDGLMTDAIDRIIQ